MCEYCDGDSERGCQDWCPDLKLSELERQHDDLKDVLSEVLFWLHYGSEATHLADGSLKQEYYKTWLKTLEKAQEMLAGHVSPNLPSP